MTDSSDSRVRVDSLATRLLERANEIYAERKRSKYPYQAPEVLPRTIESEQVKAVLEACADEIEELRRELHQDYQLKPSHDYFR